MSFLRLVQRQQFGMPKCIVVRNKCRALGVDTSGCTGAEMCGYRQFESADNRRPRISFSGSRIIRIRATQICRHFVKLKRRQSNRCI